MSRLNVSSQIFQCISHLPRSQLLRYLPQIRSTRGQHQRRVYRHRSSFYADRYRSHSKPTVVENKPCHHQAHSHNNLKAVPRAWSCWFLPCAYQRIRRIVTGRRRRRISRAMSLSKVLGGPNIEAVIDERGFVEGVKVARKCTKTNVL